MHDVLASGIVAIGWSSRNSLTPSHVMCSGMRRIANALPRWRWLEAGIIGRLDLLYASSECMSSVTLTHVCRSMCLTHSADEFCRVGEGWSGAMELPPGEYEYKFILDDIFWTHDATQVS